MTDPYKVLGVSPSATDDEVKDAYRRLARKYHPDNYVNNPLADLATEKMKEINEAYDEIQRQRKAGGNRQQGYGGYNQQGYSGYQQSYGGYQQSYSGSSQFADIRRLINLNRLSDAEELLEGISASARTAEWNYLKGVVNYRKGWLDNAVTYLNNACNMDPSNMEYRQALNQLTQHQQGYAQAGGTSMCEVCASLYCAHACCQCMGGGC